MGRSQVLSAGPTAQVNVDACVMTSFHTSRSPEMIRLPHPWSSHVMRSVTDTSSSIAVRSGS
jgi:hypothetical protein